MDDHRIRRLERIVLLLGIIVCIQVGVVLKLRIEHQSMIRILVLCTDGIELLGQALDRICNML